MSNDKRWLREHHDDEYVKKSKKEGYPSRAAYKLLEIQKRDQLIQPGMLVVDLGAAPGGWSMVASELVGRRGWVIALDLLPMVPIAGVEFIQGDFTEAATLDQLIALVSKKSPNGQVDLVISDMAPNITGQRSVDQPRFLGLVELAVDCAEQILKPGGAFLAKVFQGEGVDALIQDLRFRYKSVKIRKPKSSRARSREVFVLAEGFVSKSADS